MPSSSEPDFTENNLHEYEEEQSNRSANQISIIARLFTIGSLMLDTLEFLLAPQALLNRIDGEFDSQSYSGQEVNRDDDRSNAT